MLLLTMEGYGFVETDAESRKDEQRQLDLVLTFTNSEELSDRKLIESTSILLESTSTSLESTNK